MDEQQTPVTSSPIYQESQDKNAKWLWLLIVLIIIGALAFAYVKGIGPFSKLRFGSGETASPRPSSSPFTVSSPSPEATSEASNLDKKEPKIRVLNGTGKSGVASSAKDFITGKGYNVVAVGNADTFDYDRTFLRFKSTFRKFEEVLTKDLSGKYSVRVSSDLLEASDSADIEVIIGNQ